MPVEDTAQTWGECACVYSTYVHNLFSSLNLINDIKERDKLDSNRKTSPLVPAKDAHVIDTTIINSHELLLIVTNIIEGKNELLK